jgi:hypothetical protein
MPQFVLVAWLLCATAPATATAQQQPEQQRAEDAYRAAWAWFAGSTGGDAPVLTREERMLLNDGLSNGPPSPELRAALAKVRPYLDLVRTAAGAPTADFGLDRSRGFALTLPHLRDLRQAARILNTDARVRLADGDSDGAVESIAALAGLGRHVRGDQVVVSSLVSGAILSLQDAAIDRLLSDGAIAPEQVERLAASLEPLRTNDAIGAIDALREEGRMAREQIEAIGDDGVDLGGLFDTLGMPRPEGIDLALDGAAARTSLDQLDGVFARAITAIADPDRAAARAALAELEASVRRGDEGVLAALLAPSFSQIAESTWRIDDLIAARGRMLDELRSGKVALDHFANAALVYLEMARLVEGMPVDRQRSIEAVRLTAGAVDLDTAHDADRTISGVRSALRLLAERAATRNRCDFGAILRGTGTDAALVPEFAGALRGAMRVAMADAVGHVLGRALERPLGQAGDTSSPGAPSGSAQRPAQGVAGDDVPPFTVEEAIGAALRCVRHLTQDPAIGHAVLAAALLDDIDAVLRLADEGGALDDAAKERLRAIALGIDRTGPLGVRAALDASRRVLVREAGRWPGAGVDQVDPTKVNDDPLLRRDANAVATALFTAQLRRNAVGAGNDEERAARLAHWTDAEFLSAPLLGVGDLVVPPSTTTGSTTAATAAIATVDAVRSRVLSWMARHNGDQFVLLDWRNELEALPRAPGIDVQLRMNQAGARLAVIDDLLRPSTRPAVGDDRAP